MCSYVSLWLFQFPPADLHLANQPPMANQPPTANRQPLALPILAGLTAPPPHHHRLHEVIVETDVVQTHFVDLRVLLCNPSVHSHHPSQWCHVSANTLTITACRAKHQTRATQEFCLEHGSRLRKVEPTVKAEDKEDTFYKQRHGELEQENEFLKSQIVAPQRTIALLQSAQTAVGVKKIVPQPLPAHVPLPTAVPCVSTPTGQATTHAQPWAAARTGAFVAAVGETATHPYPLAPDPQQSSPPAREAVSMQSSSYFVRLHGEVNTFITKRNADVEREEWPFGRAPEANVD